MVPTNHLPSSDALPDDSSQGGASPVGSSRTPATDAAAPRLLDRVRDRIRVKHYSLRTEQAYVDWIRRFIGFHGKRHPLTMGAPEVEAFLSHLAVERTVASATQNQAKAALLFLYGEVLGVELPWLDGVVQAKASQRLPVVLTRDEVSQLLRRLDGVHRLVGCLLYGAGLRVMEALRLRVKDIDFVRRNLVRDGKGGKDRVTMLPRDAVRPLRRSCSRCVRTSGSDDGLGAVWLPHALARKTRRGDRLGLAVRVPGRDLSTDPRDGCAPPPFRPGNPARGAPGGAGGGHRQAGHAAHAPPFVRDAPAGGGLRHPHGAGAAGSLGRQHDDDLHARAQPRRARGGEPAGRL